MDQPMLPGMEADEDDLEALRRDANAEYRENGYSDRYRELQKKLVVANRRAARNKILDFDPNKDDENAPQYATYCPSRSGSAFKVHKLWHHATRAAKMHDGAVYKWNNLSSTWIRVEVYFDQELVEP